MSLDNRPVYTGGCQCGAVRFRIEGALGRASICHCRMCQKAFGNLFAPLVNVGKVVWTREEPARFQSSNHVRRGFCPTCGTPLTYEAPDGMALAIGAFDDPTGIAPEIQFGTEAELPYVAGLAALPRRPTLEDLEEAPFLTDVVSYQHPDHDTVPGDAATRDPA
ncbi:aldehyde-activating protein [Aureimonas endophytica]|uniref:Aldehyde-activating protein n=1 Tax=Aureimonas endophytica TaxID=2027858 RepID=A0A916ZZ88_9HYPH|nr:GFA family protein [Aureimonas endophytica]GGE18681.1 aldehyde-activating protein [Aureimonas endophytica]